MSYFKLKIHEWHFYVHYHILTIKNQYLHAYIMIIDYILSPNSNENQLHDQINNTWPLFSPIIQFITHRHKSWNERGIQSDPKGLSDVINGGGLRPSEVKRSSQSKIIKPPTADHERRLPQGVNQQESRKKYRVNAFPWVRWPAHEPEHWTRAGAFPLTPNKTRTVS